MRKLVFFTLGFALGTGLFVYGAQVMPVWGVLGFAVAGLILGALPRAQLLCFGAVLGLCWCMGFDTAVLSPVRELDGQQTELTVTAGTYSWETDYGIACDGTIVYKEREYTLRFYLDSQEELAPGDVVSGTFRLRYTLGGQESATYHPGSGIYLLAYPKGDAQIVRGGGEGSYPGPELARWISLRLEEMLPEDVLAISRALLLGDSEGLDYETDTALKLSGIRHIVAVSGLHVMLLYDLIRGLTRRNKWLTALLCLPVLVLFSAAAGFTPSVTRAAIMAALMMLADLADREYDALSALAFSVLVMLAWNPPVITSVGFQLTVLCVAGIQLFGQNLKQWLMHRYRLPGAVASSVCVTLGSMSLTTPLSGGYFGTVSLIGPVTNLLTIWLVNGIFSGLVGILGLSLVKLSWAVRLGELIAWPIRLVLWLAELLGELPLAVVYTQSPYVLAWLVFSYILLGVELSGLRKRTGLLLGCATLGLAAAVGLSWLEPRLDSVRLTMLDVGQGQCLLLQSGEENYLIDCGGESPEDAADIAAQTLLSRGIRDLDGIILTHWDEDHAGGVELLLSRVGTDILYAPPGEGEAVFVTEETTIPMGEGVLRIFPGNYGEESNENSLCVLFESENCAILVTGDRSSLGELLLLAEYDIPDCDLLIAGHHGSKYSTSDALLEAVRPEYVFISAGEDNPYGHPAPELLQRLETFGCTVAGTYDCGTILFRR